MYNVLISTAIGVAVAALVMLAGFSVWAAILPGVLAMIAAFLLFTRRIGARIQAIVSQAQKELSVQPTSQKERNQRVSRAIGLLEQGLQYEKWQMFVAPAIHGQIGMLKYAVRDLDGALPHLEKAGARNAMAKAMEGALYYKKKRYEEMERAFELAVKSGKKEGLVWSAYAWCLLQLKQQDKALAVMARAVQTNPNDERLKAGLNAIQNGKRLKMKPYEPNWWQLGLENPPLAAAGGRQTRFERR